MTQSTPIESTSPILSDAARRRTILDRKITEGSAKAARVLAAVERDMPTDAIVRSSAIRYEASPSIEGAGDMMLRASWGAPGAVPRTFSDYALAQVADRAGVPAHYLGALARAGSEGAWRVELAARILTEHGAHSDERRLVRTVRGEARDPQGEAAHRVAAVAEVRVTPLEAEHDVVARDFDDLAREHLQGHARLGDRAVGGRLSDEIEFSDRTMRLDTMASVSALRDVVRGLLSPAAHEKLTARIAAASECAVTTASLRGRLRNLDKVTAKSVVDAFESEDVINLPEGRTAWRASNAISWVAKHCADDDKRLDLERLAGEAAGDSSSS
jgi:hypothetical protein